MRMVTNRRITMAIEIASKVGVFLHCCFVCYCPGSQWVNTEQVVAQWWRSEASSVALDMLHWAIQAALQPRVCMAIKTVSEGGTFVPHC